MSDALAYPGTPELDRARNGSRAAPAQRGENTLGRTSPAAGRIRACVQAAAAGLSLSERHEALLLWVSLVKGQSGRFTVEGGAAEALQVFDEFFQSGLPESIGQLSADELDDCCSTIDALGSCALAGVAGQAADDVLARISQLLPLFAQATVATRCAKLDERRDAAKLHDLASQLLARATDPEMIAGAMSVVHADHILRAHHLARMDEATRAKIGQLTVVKRQFEAEFGELLAHGHKSAARAAVAAVFTAFSKEAQATREVEQKAAAAWQGRVSAAAGIRLFGADPYVDAFATFLEGRIDGVHNEVASALKKMRKALDAGYDPHEGVATFAEMLVFRQKTDEAREALREWIPKLDAGWKDDPDTPVAMLVQKFEEVGGRREDLPRCTELPVVVNAVSEHRAARRTEAEAYAAKAADRRRQLLAKWEAEGTTLVDGAVMPAAYDAALGSGDAAGVLRIDLAKAVALCLDEVPLFRSVDVEDLCALTTAGLPAAAAARYSIKLSEALARRDGMEWQALAKRFPNLFRSTAFAVAQVTEALAKNAEGAGARLKYFRSNQAVPEEAGLELFRAIANRMESSAPEAAARFGEEMTSCFSGAVKRAVELDTVARLEKLADGVESVFAKLSFLNRALTLDPANAGLRDRVASARGARLKKVLTIGGAVAGLLTTGVLLIKLLG